MTNNLEFLNESFIQYWLFKNSNHNMGHSIPSFQYHEVVHQSFHYKFEGATSFDHFYNSLMNEQSGIHFFF
jgi:hypothetical protein